MWAEDKRDGVASDPDVDTFSLWRCSLALRILSDSLGFVLKGTLKVTWFNPVITKMRNLC